MTTSEILDVLGGVIHPAFDKSITELGLVEDVKVEPLKDAVGNDIPDSYKVKFKLVFKSPDALAGTLKKACEEAIASVWPGVKVSIIEMVREGAAPKKAKKLELDRSSLRPSGRLLQLPQAKAVWANLPFL